MEEEAVYAHRDVDSPHYDIARKYETLDPREFPILLHRGAILFDNFDRR